jgi:hypothetical protein
MKRRARAKHCAISATDRSAVGTHKRGVQIQMQTSGVYDQRELQSFPKEREPNAALHPHTAAVR